MRWRTYIQLPMTEGITSLLKGRQGKKVECRHINVMHDRGTHYESKKG